MRSEKSIFFKIILLSVLVLGLSMLLSQNLLSGKISNITYGVLTYFTSITLVFQWGLFNSSKGKPEAFVRYYMGATAFKFMVHMAVILIYCLVINQEQAVPFIIHFAIFYLIFTVFESIASIKQFGKKA